MATLQNTVLVIKHPKGLLPANAPSVNKAMDMMAYADFFRRLGSGMEPGRPGEVRVDIHRGTTDAAPVAATGTITLATCPAGQVIQINGVDFLAVNGAATAGNNEFDISGDDTADAAALAAAIVACTTAGVAGEVTATSALGVVTVTALRKGTGGNAITLKNGGIRANGTVTYSGSSGAQTVTINGVQVYNATGASDAANATAAAAAINASANALVSGHVKAVARAGVCYIYSTQDGTQGNTNTLAATGTGATASGARLTGGTTASVEGAQATGTFTLTGVANAETCTVNGVTLTAHTNTDANNQFRIDGTDTVDAEALARAINNSTSALLAEVIATAAAGVVTVTSRKGGIAGNRITLTTGQASIVVSGARLTGGAVPTTVVLSGPTLTGGVGGNATAKSFQF